MKKIIILLLVGSIFLAGCGPDTTYDEFTKCLTASGMKFYGAFWCPYCENMKEKFSDSAKYISYVECDPRGANAQPEQCEANNVEGYPTFIFADGSRISEETSLFELGQRTGCSLPK